jgi:hypothetical protein
VTEFDWTEGWDYESWAEHIRSELIPMIGDSTFTMSLVPSGGGYGDIKFAVELGVSIMLDKPIIALVMPGVKVPDHLVRVADRIVEIDFNEPDKTAKAVGAVLKELSEELGLDKEN